MSGIETINGDWVMYEIAKLNQRSFVNLSKDAIEALIKQSEDGFKKQIKELANPNSLDIRNLYAMLTEQQNLTKTLRLKVELQIECNDILSGQIAKLEKKISKLVSQAKPKKEVKKGKK